MTQPTLHHWKSLTNTDYIGAYVLQPGEEKTLTIKSAGQETVKGTDGTGKPCLVIHFQEPNTKPMVCNATNAKTISRIHKSSYIEGWIGKRITIYATAVKAFGDTVDALRIRDYVPKDTELDVTNALTKLNQSKTIAELKSNYESLTKSEQSNDKVLKLKDELKVKLTTNASTIPPISGGVIATDQIKPGAVTTTGNTVANATNTTAPDQSNASASAHPKTGQTVQSKPDQTTPSKSDHANETKPTTSDPKKGDQSK